MNKIRLTLLIFALLQGLHGYLSAQPKSSAFSVQLDPSAGKPLSGRLYIFSNTDTTRGVGDPDPFNPSPTF
ncbi:MAG: hypothetical protein MUE99_12295 [Chitinophagaceae bacterium]|nr:hypothetical protein [Chitinophagaceae bacterium]